MFCSECGKEISDESRFCKYCGKANVLAATASEESPVESFQPAAESVHVAEPTEPLTEGVSAPSEPAAQFTGEMPLTEQPADVKYADGQYGYMPYIPPAKNKSVLKKLLAIGIPCLTAVIAVVVVLSIVLSCGGPMTEISEAIEKSFNASSAEISISAGPVSIDGTYIFDRKNKNITLHAKTNGYEFGIQDGYLGACIYGSYEYQDVKEYCDKFFDVLDEIDKKDKKEEFDWDELCDAFDIDRSDIDDYIDTDAFEKSLKNFSDLLNDEDWLKENMAFDRYERNGSDIYFLRINGESLSNLIYKSFKDSVKKSKLSDFREGCDSIQDEVGIIDIEFGITDGCFTSLEVTYNSISISLFMSEFNTADVDVEELQYFIKKCKKNQSSKKLYSYYGNDNGTLW